MVEDGLVAKQQAKKSPWREGKANAASFTIGAEAANVINVAVQLKDGNSEVVEAVCLKAYLSSDTAGQVVIPTAHSSSPAIGTDGLLIPILTDKAFLVTSEADGDIDIDFTETGALTVYLVLIMPDGSLEISGAITHAA